MNWIVLGEKNGKIALVSKDSNHQGMLPKGSFLTIQEGNTKFILRVEDSQQHEPYSPLPLVIDMDLTPLNQDRKCKNIIVAYRVFDFTNRDDGLIDYIKPQSLARLSNQQEIDLALGGSQEGPKVFVATVQYNQNQLLKDKDNNFITATLPNDMFYHQMLICGKTGSGKTVATKYLAQYFVEKLGGAVLAVNVKSADLLKMDQKSISLNPSVKKEWDNLGEEPHPIRNFTVYYPANTEINPAKGVTNKICYKITLDVKKIEPEALIGLLTNITDIGAMSLIDIFRCWQENQAAEDEQFTFTNFVRYFNDGINQPIKYQYAIRNSRGEDSSVTIHRSTYDNIMRNLNAATSFFDNKGADTIDESDILEEGKMSVIDVVEENGIQFGSILLRHLLRKIVRAKSEKRSKIPILIIIDEVHQFYNEDASYEALGDLDTICRTGRDQKIGVIFSSQNPNDIPKGLSAVINTKIFFKTDVNQVKIHGIAISAEEMESLRNGYAVASIYELSQLKILKFPLAYSGVFEE
jgi:hypothetical protein